VFYWKRSKNLQYYDVLMYVKKQNLTLWLNFGEWRIELDVRMHSRLSLLGNNKS
jgi:hypothetical protein